MQVIFLYLFFLTTFSRGIATEERLPESADNTLLTADVKKLPSAKESHVPEDGDSVNVEEILRELNEERAKNRDLNQTISDILERMADMEGTISENQRKIDMVNVFVGSMSEDVVSNRDDITVNQLKTELLTRDVGDLQDDVTTVQDEVVAVAEDVESLSSSDQQQAAQIQSLGTRGTWCGYIFGPWNTVGTITYDSLTFSDSNMEIAGTPLDINTGNYSHKCY